MFDILRFFRSPGDEARRADIYRFEEYYTPARRAGPEPARLSALEQMYAYYGAR